MSIIIDVINESTLIKDSYIHPMIPAFEQQWNSELAVIWGVRPAKFGFVAKGAKPTAGSWWLVFLDDSDQAGALAYHDLTDQGLPISKVFVKTIMEDNASVSKDATHELCEMAVDPWLNSAAQDDKGVFWASEICDPVQADQYGYMINGILVTDFVTPNWFAHRHSVGSIDFKGHSMSAFEVLTGGYAQYFDAADLSWVQVTGSKAIHSAKANAAHGSRRERRVRGWNKWERSAPKF